MLQQKINDNNWVDMKIRTKRKLRKEIKDKIEGKRGVGGGRFERRRRNEKMLRKNKKQ